MLHAFVDESARRRRGESTCVYTLAAVVVADESMATRPAADGSFAVRQEPASPLAGGIRAALTGDSRRNVTFESRAEQDRHDRAVLTYLRRSAAVRSDMSVTWRAAEADPLLWSTDIAAGAMSWWLDGQGEYWELLDHLMTVIDVEP
jgi:hypothetical protein